MGKLRISAALAAERLHERQRPVLQLELPDWDRRFEEPPSYRNDDGEPTALVLEADGSFTERRD